MLEGTPVCRLVIHLGIPAMFGQLFNILYNIVDRIFIGKIPETGSLSLAGIGVCAPALTALTAFAFMVGIGGASYMSISLGQKEERRAQDIIGNAFFMLLTISAVVTPLLLLNREKFYTCWAAVEICIPMQKLILQYMFVGLLHRFLSVG